MVNLPLQGNDAKMEEENLIEDIFHEYKDKNGNNMREYHVDSIENFSFYPLTFSVQRNPQLMPIIIVGQDESDF